MHYHGESWSEFQETEAKKKSLQICDVDFQKENDDRCSRINVIASAVHQCSSESFFGAYHSKVVTLSCQVHFLLSEQGISCLLMHAIAPHSNCHPQKCIDPKDYVFLKAYFLCASRGLCVQFYHDFLHNYHDAKKLTSIF